MTEGAFSFIMHDHYFEEKDGQTLMTDVFRYGVPYGILGKFFDFAILKAYMWELLSKRNTVIKAVAERMVNGQ